MHLRTARAMRVELAKQASPLHLLLGIPGHIGVNAGGRAAHHATNLAEVLAHHGFQHGATGAQIAPSMRASMGLIAGPESMANYSIAKSLGEMLYSQNPAKRTELIQAIANGTAHPDLAQYSHILQSGGPVSSAMMQAAKHEVAGTVPKFTARSVASSKGIRSKAEALGGRFYGGIVDKMRRVEQSPFATPLQKTVSNVVGAVPAVGMMSVDPFGSGAHFAINTGRGIVGDSRVGKEFMVDQFQRGFHGHTMSPAKEKLWDYAVSPAVLDTRREGAAARAAGITPEKVRKTLPLARAATPHVLPPKHQQFAHDAANFAERMAQPPAPPPGLWQQAKNLFSKKPTVAPPSAPGVASVPTPKPPSPPTFPNPVRVPM